MTTDKEHLQWIFDRLINVHKENANYDYMQRLQKIIETTKPVNVALVDVSGSVCCCDIKYRDLTELLSRKCMDCGQTLKQTDH